MGHGDFTANTSRYHLSTELKTSLANTMYAERDSAGAWPTTIDGKDGAWGTVIMDQPNSGKTPEFMAQYHVDNQIETAIFSWPEAIRIYLKT